MIPLESVRDGSIIDRNFQKLRNLVIDTAGKTLGIRFGVSSVTFTASATSATATVTHGLGKTPGYIGLTPVSSASWYVLRYLSGSRNSTSFQVSGRTIDGTTPSLTASFFWMVIG